MEPPRIAVVQTRVWWRVAYNDILTLQKFATENEARAYAETLRQGKAAPDFGVNRGPSRGASAP